MSAQVKPRRSTFGYRGDWAVISQNSVESVGWRAESDTSCSACRAVEIHVRQADLINLA